MKTIKTLQILFAALFLLSGPLNGYEHHTKAQLKAAERWTKAAKKKVDEVALSAFITQQITSIKTYEGTDLGSIGGGTSWWYNGLKKRIVYGAWVITPDDKFRLFKMSATINGSKKDSEKCIVIYCERVSPQEFRFLSIAKEPIELDIY